MWLGVVLFCLTPDAASCDVLINTNKLYLTQEQCWNEAEIVALTIVNDAKAVRSSYACLPFEAAGKPA